MKNNNKNGKNGKSGRILTPEEAKKRFLSTLGLAARAGKIVCGTQNVCDALKFGVVSVVFEASGNSDNTHKRLCDRCKYYKVDLIPADADADTLGAALGKRGPISAVAVTDASLGGAARRAAECAAEAKKTESEVSAEKEPEE